MTNSVPNFSLGTIPEKFWRKVGDTDECAVVSDQVCLHSLRGDLRLKSADVYRSAAGNPDDPAILDGLSTAESAKAIKTLWPEIGNLIVVLINGPWSTVEAAINNYQPVSLSVRAGSLPWHGTYISNHRIAAYQESPTDRRALDPLKDAFSSPIKTTMDVLAKAASDYPEPGINAIIFPTVEQAFAVSPMFKNAYNAGVAAAASAVTRLIKP